jgi:hypothetical protein
MGGKLQAALFHVGMIINDIRWSDLQKNGFTARG